MKLKNFVWTPGHTIMSYQILLVILFPFYVIYGPPLSWKMILYAVFLYCASMMSITAGYHRLYSHKSYKTNKWIEFPLIFFGSMAGQGSALRWAFDHRNHHAFSDTEKDLYSIKKGFWHAHFLWLCLPSPPIEPKFVQDLMKNRLVMSQHKYINLWMIGTNLLMTILGAWLFNDYVGALFIAFGLRLALGHHCTFFINSLAHTKGSRPFGKTESAVDNYFISFVTFGEGFHNFHHTFPNDYRNGIRWFDFDPTKWLVWLLKKVGLAKDLKQVSKEHILDMMNRANELDHKH
ncbi:MAG: acyl-CoA desaturase [Rhabdochlamydiaceae bacterium]